MKWVRAHIKHGSRLALLALAIQFVVSFGHFHGTSAQAEPAIAAAATQSPSASAGSPAPANTTALNSAIGTGQSQPGSSQDSDQQPTDVCAICAVMALANAALFASPPLLQLPQAVEFLFLTTDADFVHLNSAHIAFQPRAPPAS
jgi:hypothetical protein